MLASTARNLLFLSMLVGILVAFGETTKPMDIGLLRQYAQQFEPCTPEGDCRNLYSTPDDVREVLEKHDITPDYIRPVLLVLLKQYNYEYSKFHQGYELRRPFFRKQSAFVSAFIRIAGAQGDNMTARVAYDWVKKHPEYLRDELIAEQVREIERTEESIEKMIEQDGEGER